MAFILAVLEQLVDLGKFRAAVSLGGCVGLTLSYEISGFTAVLTSLGAAFLAPFLVALADRITAVPLSISRALGQPR